MVQKPLARIDRYLAQTLLISAFRVAFAQPEAKFIQLGLLEFTKIAQLLILDHLLHFSDVISYSVRVGHYSRQIFVNRPYIILDFDRYNPVGSVSEFASRDHGVGICLACLDIARSSGVIERAF